MSHGLKLFPRAIFVKRTDFKRIAAAHRVQLPAAMYAVQLNPGHGWKAAPGCRILIVDGGAVRLDFPETWTVISMPKYVCVMDRCPPENRSLLAIAWRRFPISAFGIPLTPLINEA